MWNSYFYNIQKKYSMRLSRKTPLVIRLDGKSVTKNKNLNLLDLDNENSFSNSLEKTVKHFTEKYKCFSFFGSDEVSFIFEEPDVVLKDLDSEGDNHSNEIIALFTQYFFDYFNEMDKHKKVYWHGKCFSIPENKVKSYIKYRSRIIQNVMSTYYLVHKGAYRGNEKLESRLDKCKKFKDYKKYEDMCNGILYYNGKRINTSKYINEDKIEEINKIDVDNAFSDLM